MDQVGILFKPSAGKLKNLEARDYMGKAVHLLDYKYFGSN